MGKQVRMADIAEKLNLSVVSVSKALAGKPGISEENRAKVIELARQMGYTGVRSTARQSTDLHIGVLVADHYFAENAFYTQLYRSLVLDSRALGMTCLIEIIPPEAEQAAVLPALITDEKVDGILFMGNLEEDYVQMVENSGLPCVLLDFRLPGRARDCVLSDNTDGGFALTTHLLRQGRTKIGFAGSVLSSSSIMERYLGYLWAMQRAGLAVSDQWRIEDRGPDGRFIPLVLPEDMPEAFLCSCDEVAYNLVTTLQQAGFDVPEDVAVCGYDDYKFASLCRPQLTTYRVDIERMSKHAVKWLHQKINNPKTDASLQIIPGQIIMRESSGANS